MYPVVIPVAGLGTRSLPASKVIPKEMLPVFNRPVIQIVVEEMVDSGLKDIVLVSSEGKSSIEKHFQIQPELEEALQKAGKKDLYKMVYDLSRLINILSVPQKEPLGLGHAVLQAKSKVKASHFVVALADELVGHSTPATMQLLQKYESRQAEQKDIGVIMLMKVGDADVSKYGICELSDESRLKISKCIEKPQPTETSSRYAITGRYFLPRDIFDILENQQKGELGEIQLTDALDQLARQGRLYGCLLQGERFDTGDKIGFLKATLYTYLQSDLKSEVQKILKELA